MRVPIWVWCSLTLPYHRTHERMQSLLWFHLTAGRGGSNSATTTNGHKNNGRPRPVPQPLVGHSRARDVFQPEELVGKVDHMFFFGDLNYRLELPREDVEVCVCM